MTFSIKDTNQMTWGEVDDLVDIIIAKVLDKNINVVAPLLRTGGIVGGIVSIKMKVEMILPVQFKHTYQPKKISQMISLPDLLCDVPDSLNILLCEGNTSTGSTAILSARAIKEKYPHAKVYLATLTKVYGCPDKLEGIDEIFYGTLTNENFKASEEEVMQLNIRKGITIFPWEDAEVELNEVNKSEEL